MAGRPKGVKPKHVLPPRWKKGESGNPSGRPKGYGQFRELCRDYTAESVKTLVSVMRSAKAPPSAKVQAASVLIDHGWGRPQQTVNINDERTIHELTRSELLEILAGGDRTGVAEPDGGARVADKVH